MGGLESEDVKAGRDTRVVSVSAESALGAARLSTCQLGICRLLLGFLSVHLSARPPPQAMASALRERSASASIPSFTADSLGHIPVPSLFTVSPETATWLWTSLAIVAALLVLEQSVWRYKKRHLPGDSWTIPIIGKFADSMKPTMEGYMRQWNSGALSAISVFNM